jgi:biotin carboxyl carrier protein
MKLTEEEIIEILRFVDQSNLDELCLEIEGLKLIARKGLDKIPDRRSKSDLTEPINSIPSTESTIIKDQQKDILPSLNNSNQKAVSEGETYHEEDGLISIKAPRLGIFYRYPEPGSPPFVEIGTYVTEETTVCLIELMKLFTALKAGVRGRIAKICAENAQMVEYHQTLFLIDPKGKP